VRPVPLDLIGQRIERILLDYAISLLTDRGVEIKLETPFTLSTAGQLTETVDPARPASGMARLVGLLHQVVTEASVLEGTGTLLLAFSGGLGVQIDPAESYEAWTIAGPDGVISVSLPGGGYANWAGTHAITDSTKSID
jgi:hypothetical protein